MTQVNESGNLIEPLALLGACRETSKGLATILSPLGAMKSIDVEGNSQEADIRGLLPGGPDVIA